MQDSFLRRTRNARVAGGGEGGRRNEFTDSTVIALRVYGDGQKLLYRSTFGDEQ